MWNAADCLESSSSKTQIVLSGQTDEGTGELRKRETWFCFSGAGLTSLHRPSVSVVDFVEIEKSRVRALVVQT